MLLRFGDCELHPGRFELRRKGERVAVEPKVLELILYLVRHRSRAVARSELLDAVWRDVKVGEDAITRAVGEARRAIGDDAREIIVTVRSHGFRFDAPVVEIPVEAPAAMLGDPLVGREVPLAAIGAQLAGAVAGRAAFTWIQGVAGIGKTRLLEEVAARARSQQVDVHLARCHETVVGTPFRPWLTILDAIARGGGADAEPARAACAALAERGADRAYDLVARALFALGRARPRVLAFDDLQWADEGTVDLLRFVAREAREAPLFVIGTLCDTVHADDARSRAMGRLLGEYGGVHLELRGLSRDETRQLIKARKGVEPPEPLCAAVHERTGGCPLFIQQVLETEWAARALEDEARTVATSIDMRQRMLESAVRHLEGVSAEARDTLAWAAVLGKSFTFALLARITALGPDVLLDRLEEARRARVVARVDEGDYRFVHPMVADALYARLSASERAARHRSVALALEAHYGPALEQHAAQIARHFVRAAPTGTAREALDYCMRAARYALGTGDPRRSVKHWVRAIRVLDFIPASETTRFDLLLDLSRAYVRGGEVDRARDALFDAAMLAQALGRADSLAETALELAELVPRDDPRRLALLTDARATVQRTGGARAETLVRRLEHASRS
ncbi:MAG: ATP-binding protein [Polyangiaceae bacterium]